MVVATINWALLLITESIVLLDLRKYANAMLIHTSNYVLFNMWRSGTLRPWLTGKSIGSVKNLRNDSDLKWLCRAKIMSDERAACLCSLSSPVWLIQVFVSLSVETCWKYAASPSCLPPTPGTKKGICKWNCSARCLWKWRASRCVCCQSTCTRSSFFFFFEIQKKISTHSSRQSSLPWSSSFSSWLRWTEKDRVLQLRDDDGIFVRTLRVVPLRDRWD